MDNEGWYCWQVLLEPSSEQRGELWADFLAQYQHRIEAWARNAPMDSPALSLGGEYF